ncbi:MAG: hypothetical protein QOE45_176 [Frankiaceae bacterium]|jgi:DNA-binding NarL/FixJ family response regulator|nr:hypothetical protein [Frankiaceae bacterium]
MTAIRVYVVDDHPVVLEGLGNALTRAGDIALVGTAATGEAALADLRSVEADVVLVDAQLPGMSGADLCASLRDRPPAPRCVVLTGRVDTGRLRAAIEAEARGFLVKDSSVAAIVDAVRRVHGGEIVLDPRATGLMVGHLRSDAHPPVALTPREHELVTLLATGMSNPQIARHLRISANTAKSYVSRVLVKLDVTTRAAAVARAAELGLLGARPAGPTRRNAP